MCKHMTCSNCVSQEELDALRKRNATLNKENDILRGGLIKIRFYFDHIDQELTFDPTLRAYTSAGRSQIDRIILSANKMNPDPLEEYYDVRPDNGYED